MSDRGYPIALRKRVVEAYENAEGTYEQVANRFKVSVRCVTNWMKLKRETGSIEPRPHGGGTAPVIDDRGERLLTRWVEETSNWTLLTLMQRLKTEGYEVSEATVSRTLAKMEITHKKSPSARASKIAQTSRMRVRPGRDA